MGYPEKPSDKCFVFLWRTNSAIYYPLFLSSIYETMSIIKSHPHVWAQILGLLPWLFCCLLFTDLNLHSGLHATSTRDTPWWCMAEAFSSACRRATDICWREACIIVLLPGETVIIPPLKNFLPPNQAHNVFPAVPMLQVTASLGHPKSLISGQNSC